jgi:hypothetical protein
MSPSDARACLTERHTPGWTEGGQAGAVPPRSDERIGAVFAWSSGNGAEGHRARRFLAWLAAGSQAVDGWPPPPACSQETLATVSRRRREWLPGCARRPAAGREDQARRGELRREGSRHTSEAARSGVHSRRRSKTRVRQATGEAGRR